MFKNAKGLLIVIAIILLVIAIVYLCVKDYELVKRERYNGFSSDVTQSRYSILQEYLERMGLNVERHVRVTSINNLSKSKGVLFIGLLPDRYSESELSTMLDWVKAGGHIIINADLNYYYDEDNPHILLEKLGVSRKYIPYDDRIESNHFNILLDEKSYDIENSYISTAISISDPKMLLNNEHVSDKFIQLKHHSGIVTVLSTTDFMMNNNLIDNDHALFTYDIFMQNNNSNTLWIVEQPRMPHFTELIWDYFKTVVISCVVLLLTFIVWKGRRFGSIITIEDTSRRSLLEQIHAAGLFAVKTKTLGKLVDRVRNDLKRKIERKHPTIIFDSDGDIYGEIALITLIDRKEIEYAFNYKAINQQIEFFNLIKTLQKIGKNI